MTEKWIDVSTFQGVINWQKVAASGIKGAVVRAGYGNDIRQTDKRFVDNIRGAIAAGLKVAVYWFSYADTVADAQKEWQTCKQVISPYKDKILFVAYDYEYDSVRYYKKIHGKTPANSVINDAVNAFLRAAKADGYVGVLYTNNDYRKNIFSAQTLAAWKLWLADYTGKPDVPCMMQQTGPKGHINGINGNVDMDTMFEDISVKCPPYTCDTSGIVEVERGKAYQAEITAEQIPYVVAGTPDVVAILPRYNKGNKWYYYFVPIGKPGDGAGIYINRGQRQFIVKIK